MPKIISSRVFNVNFLTGALCAGVIGVSDVSAANNNADIALEHMVVTGTRRLQATSESPVSISVVSQQELRESTADNMADILKNLPGIQITDSGQAGMKRIRIRGEDASRTAILVDGQEVTDHRGQGVPLTVDPYLVERVEVIRGGGGVLYGSKALGGVINFITKKGGDKLFQIEAGAGFNSANNAEQAFASMFGIVKGIDYRLSASKDTADDRETPEGSIDNTRSQSESQSAYLSGESGIHHLAFNWDNHDAFSEVFVEDDVRTGFPFIDFGLEIPARDRQKSALRYTVSPENSLAKKVEFSIFDQTSERIFKTRPVTQIGPNRTDIETTTDSTLNTDGVDLQSDWQLGSRHYTIAGFQFDHDDMMQNRTRFEAQNGGPSVQIEDITEKASMSTYALYLQDQWTPLAPLTITAGARYYWVESDLENTNRDGIMANSQNDSQLIKSLAAVYTHKKNISTRVNYGEGYVYPSLLQLATGAVAGSSFANPNPELVPEENYTAELGIRVQNNDYEFDIAAFHMSAENYIDFIPCTPADNCIGGRRARKYQNIGSSNSFGFEFSGSTGIGDAPIRLSTVISYLRKKNSFDSFETYETGVPKVAGEVSLRWSPARGRARFWLEPSVAVESETFNRESLDQREENERWATANIRAGATFGEDDSIMIALEFRNISDRTYRYATENITAAGRSAALKVSFKTN